MARLETIRLQIEVDREQMEEIEQLAEEGGLRTKKELLNNALTLLKWAARNRAAGRAIGSLQPGTEFRELEMPFLDAVATAGRRSNKVSAQDQRGDATPARTRRLKIG